MLRTGAEGNVIYATGPLGAASRSLTARDPTLISGSAPAH